MLMGDAIKLKRAVVYARVSSQEQSHGYSIEAQLDLLRQFAGQNQIRILHEYVDVETAKQTGRTNYNRMLDEIKALIESQGIDNAPLILAEKTDRLYRNLLDWVALDALKINIVMVKENALVGPDSHSSEKLIHGIKVLMAKNYIDNLREETQKGMRKKAELGFYPSCAPLGYNNVQHGDKRIIEPDPDRAHLIADLFQTVADKNLSLRLAVDYGFMVGLRSRKGNKVGRTCLNAILRNPLYYGQFTWNGDIYDGTHEPIITKHLFDRVQAILDNKNRNQYGWRGLKFAFGGLVQCGTCGCRFVAERKQKKSRAYVYYHCSRMRGTCDNREFVREEDMAGLLGDALQALEFDWQVIDWMRDGLIDAHKDETEHRDIEVANRTDVLKEVRGRIDRAYDDYCAGLLRRADYQRRLTEWKTEAAQLEAEIKSLRFASERTAEQGVELLELAQTAHSRYVSADVDEKGRIVASVCSNSVFDHGTLRMEFKEPFDILAKFNREMKEKDLNSLTKTEVLEKWLPGTDLNRRPSG